MANAWYSDIVQAGKQSATALKKGVQTAAQQAVSSTAQAAQKSVTGAIQKGTQKVTSKIGPAPAKPVAAKPAPAKPAPAIARPVAPAVPAKREEVKKAGVPMIALLAVAGGAIWYFFLRKK
jgi:hypothetical protein